jgi:hypothetical protein
MRRLKKYWKKLKGIQQDEWTGLIVLPPVQGGVTCHYLSSLQGRT